MITTNFNLLREADEWKIHFNVQNLETVIWYSKKDKNPIWIYKTITDENFRIDESLFPEKLQKFIWLDINENDDENPETLIRSEIDDELPF